ncbi:MAG: hypothetical protein EOP49_00840 [Sphingobacteriales bacterium]|nr:MAG: hypothetical protein EOP49_00840 [Sphingobacteriales bacterium]
MIPVSAHPIKLYESLFIFWKTNMLVSKMYENFVDQIRKEEDSKDTFLSTHISFYITMEFVTFLDEYHNHFTTTPGEIGRKTTALQSRN